MANITYISTDIESPLAMVRADIQSMSFADKTFDCIICYHVLEHVPDDRKAMKELFRVLKPHGWALIQSPVDIGLEHTFEDPSIVSPEERVRLFGQDDHVRMYGRDFKRRVEDAGFTVSVEDYGRQLREARAEQYGLVEGELLYFCLRNEQ
jgi:SAM-dependent methyltransferase